MVLVPAGRQFCLQNSSFLMFYAQHCRIEMISTCFGDILESPDFIFARKRLKRAVASALNSNNNKETQH